MSYVCGSGDDCMLWIITNNITFKAYYTTIWSFTRLNTIIRSRKHTGKGWKEINITIQQKREELNGTNCTSDKPLNLFLSSINHIVPIKRVWIPLMVLFSNFLTLISRTKPKPCMIVRLPKLYQMVIETESTIIAEGFF